MGRCVNLMSSLTRGCRYLALFLCRQGQQTRGLSNFFKDSEILSDCKCTAFIGLGGYSVCLHGEDKRWEGTFGVARDPDPCVNLSGTRKAVVA